VITMYIDGGSRGNPGPAGYGVRVEDAHGDLLERFCGAVGVATNNVAEYKGLLAALEWAADRGHRRVHVRSDSELLVRQMTGEYRVKNAGLQPLHTAARALMARIGHVTYEHVRREANRDADLLANEAMDAASSTAASAGSEPTLNSPGG
jgi:ribonuclease HI